MVNGGRVSVFAGSLLVAALAGSVVVIIRQFFKVLLSEIKL